MTAGLGIAVGTLNSRLAVSGDDGSAPATGLRTVTRPSTVHVSADGAVAPTAGDATAPLSGFVDRVADPVGLLDDHGNVHRGEDLVAATVTGLVTACDATGPVVVAHPTTWNGYTASALAAALTRSGSAATLVPDAAACVRWLESVRGPLGDGVVVVYDLGASGLEVTAIRTGADPAVPAVLGTALRSEDIGGAQLDHLVTRYVLDTLADKVPGLDPFDADTTTTLAGLRRHCAAAKEALSSDTETVLPVALPGFVSDVRLVRSEVEDLFREPLTASLDLVREALRAAEIEVSDVETVLLVGGGGAIPLLAELVSSELGLAVTVARDPAGTAAAGAALLAADAADAAAAAEPAPGFAVPDRRDAVAAPAGVAAPSFPSRIHRPHRWGARRRITVVAAAAAAIGVLTASGLAIGTGTPSAPTPSAGGTAPATGSAVATADTASGGDAAVTVSGTGVGVGTGAGAGAAVSATTGRAPANSSRAQTGTTATAAVDGAAAATTAAPTVPAPAAGGSPSWPEFTPPPAPDLSRIGTGIGDAATGIGQGVGGVVGGIGAGVGGVVDGLGGVVGAVVDPVTGLLPGN